VLNLFDLQGNGETTNLENGTNRIGPNEREGSAWVWISSTCGGVYYVIKRSALQDFP
jgi:hypothetical protein